MSIKDVKRLRLSSQSTTKQSTIESELSKRQIDFETNGKSITVRPKDDNQKFIAISMCCRFGFTVPKSELDKLAVEDDSWFECHFLNFSKLMIRSDYCLPEKHRVRTLGWHVDCDSCKEILSIEPPNREL